MSKTKTPYERIILRDDYISLDDPDLTTIDPDTDEERQCKDWDEANEVIRMNADDEMRNLDKFVDGVVVGFASLGLWNGRRNGGRVFGDKANSIFDYCEDYSKWYADRYNVRGSFSHHDGTNHVLFRVAKSREEAERLVEAVAYEGMTEETFRKRTKSLRPYIAKIYGW